MESYLQECTKITEVNLSAFAYSLFHGDFSSLVRAKFSGSTTCDSRTNLNDIFKNVQKYFVCIFCSLFVVN